MIAVVTGAGSGIGRAAARALLQEGWSVVAAGRRQARCARPRARTASRCHRRHRPPDSVNALFARLERYGRVDLLFNNAGMGASTPVTELALRGLEGGSWTRT